MIFASVDGAPDDGLEELWGRVNEVRKAGREDPGSWSVKSIPPVMAPFAADLAEGANSAHAPPPLAVPAMTFGGAAEALAAFPVRARMRILSQQLTEGLWEAGDWGPLERFVAEEYLADTLWAGAYSRPLFGST